MRRAGCALTLLLANPVVDGLAAHARVPRIVAKPAGVARAPLAVVVAESEAAKKNAEAARAFQLATAGLTAQRRAEAAGIDAASPVTTAEAEYRECKPIPHWVEEASEIVERGTLPGIALVGATALSLSLANLPATSAAWLGLWNMHLGPHIGSHALSLRAWVNEGLMAIFFFVVGLEIKQELRVGSLASVRKAALPCIAALGGMVTPMAVYFLVQVLLGGGSMLALTVPMATDIAFAMAIFGKRRPRARRPARASCA